MQHLTNLELRCFRGLGSVACVLQKGHTGKIYFRCYFNLTLAATIDEIPLVGKLHFGKLDQEEGEKVFLTLSSRACMIGVVHIVHSDD